MKLPFDIDFPGGVYGMKARLNYTNKLCREATETEVLLYAILETLKEIKESVDRLDKPV